MRFLHMSALLPEALQQMHSFRLHDLLGKQQAIISSIENVSTARVLLQAHEDVMHHHWTHNSTRDTLATDDTLFTMLLVSMTAVSTMLITFWCIIQAYSWNAKRYTVTPSAAVVTMIGSTDALHKEKPAVGTTYTATYT